MRIALLFTILSLSLLTCKEDEVIPKACEVENFGLVCIENSYSETVTIEFSGTEAGNISSGKTTCFPITPGTYTVYAYETDALLFPDEWEFTISIAQCDKLEENLLP